MTGDYTRDTTAHGRSRKYSRLLMQQGRVAVDADWNEQVERERELSRQAARDAFGPCGVPRDRPGFAVLAGGAGGFTLGAGRLYADGVLVELDQDTAADDQPFGGATLADVADGARVLVYLRVEERQVTALDDVRLREKALGGPDTMTRVQTRWQTQVVPIGVTGLTEAQILQRMQDRVPFNLPPWAATTGRMGAASSVAAIDDDGRPCLLPPTSGYSDQLNSLYRVEIHESGDETTARYKWSRRNGSVRGRLEQQGGDLVLIGREANELIGNGSWVEVQTPDDLRTGRPGRLSTITIAADQTVTFDANAGGANVAGAIVTLWDNPAVADAAGIPVHTAAQLLESGVEVTFDAGTYAAGEYWLIPARAETGDIEWPPVAGGPMAVRPFTRGPWFCPLALATRAGQGVQNLVDLRVDFPPLTAIRAGDVSYDNSLVDIDGAVTVQEALERLAQRKTGTCTLHAAPGLGWERVFNQIDAGRDAEVCLEVGEYLLEDVLRVVDKGHLTVSGRGRGTHIVAPSHESAMQFIRCASVTVRNLRISAGTSRKTTRRPGRNGALECRDCGPVVIESVSARNRGTVPRSAACISVVRSSRSPSRTLGRGDVTVRGCTLEIGFQQIGLQVVNARRATLTDNVLFPEQLEAPQVWEAIRLSRQLRREVADLLVAHRRPRRVVDGDQTPVADDLKLTDHWVDRTFVLDEHQVVAVAEPRVAERIVAYLAEAGPPGVQNSGDLSTHIRNALMQAMTTDGLVQADFRESPPRRGGFDLLASWIKEFQNRAHTHASQGIVVGGEAAQLVQIRGNEVFGAVQGVHVGLSHQGQTASDRDIADRVEVTKNTVTVAVVPLARARHGIFCGNAQSALINDNVIRRLQSTFATTERLPVTGVHVHGFAGPFVEIKNNDVRGCATGVRFVPSGGKFKAPLWLIEDNLLLSAVSAVSVPAAAAPLVRKNKNNLTG